MPLTLKHFLMERPSSDFYQVFHKLHTLEFFARSQVPPVRCSGETRDFIMSIRTGPLQVSHFKIWEIINAMSICETVERF